MPERLFFASKWFFFEKEQSDFFLKIYYVKSFYALEISLENIYYTFAEEPDKIGHD